MVPNRKSKLNYQYYLTDYLSNTRVVFGDDNDDRIIETIQVNSYYPFGMNIGDLSNIAGLENNYLLQGNEIQKDAFDVDGDGQIDRTFLWHDFNARFYDAQLGRWHVPDPILNDFSPYSVNHNNPLLFTDKSGLNPDYPEGWLFAPNTLPEPDIRWIRPRSGASIAPLRGPTGYYSAATNAPYFWSTGWGTSGGAGGGVGGGDNSSTADYGHGPSAAGENSYTPPPPPTKAEQEAYGKKQLVDLGGKIGNAAKEEVGYSIDAAVNWLNENSYSSYSAAKAAGDGAACARYIRYSLEAGFGLQKDAFLGQTPVPARSYGHFLESQGFQAVMTIDYLKGDIAVIQGYLGGTSDANGIPYGHIQMYNGTQWLSNWKQNAPFWPGRGYSDNQLDFQIYRWVINP